MNFPKNRLFLCTKGIGKAMQSALLISFGVFPSFVHAAPVDQGPVAATNIQSASLVLKLRNKPQLVDFVLSTTDPRSPNFHQYLSVSQFMAAYSPLPNQVNTVVSDLKAHGLSVTSVSANNLVIKASGKVGDFDKYFSTSVHLYKDGQNKFVAPSVPPVAPQKIRTVVDGIAGLSSQRLSIRKTIQRPAIFGTNSIVIPNLKPNSTATGIPGQFTVGDTAAAYQVQPLYDSGLFGQGRTIGIVTLATFDEADAYAYWKGIGLPVKQGRITMVDIDGGGDTGGQIETTLNVQQAGGLAPQADIVVYDGLPYPQSFLNTLNRAVIENRVDTLSTGWGLPETLTSPDFIKAFDSILLEAAAQGITVITASGDAGAFDLNNTFPTPTYSQVYSVDYPGTSPYVTCAGGLTLAGNQKFGGVTVTIPQDRPWGWNYLVGLSASLNLDYYSTLFPVGGGGGVSIFEPLPIYQKGTSGIKPTQPSQFLRVAVPLNSGGLTYLDPLAINDLPQFPDDFAGRNVPDISLNADPATGFLVNFAGNWLAGEGGTSFVAPQLNGIAALIGQSIGARLGLLNPVLYRLAQKPNYHSKPPFNDIISGDNLGYPAVPGYDQASGLGSINAANLAAAFADDSDR